MRHNKHNKPWPTPQIITVEDMMRSSVVSLRRLASFIGLSIAKWNGRSDEKWRLATAVARWYKRNPRIGNEKKP
jgi:hypothetical protein